MRFILFLLSTLAIAGDFATSLGDTYPYMISAITTDLAGNTYVVGSRALGGVYFGVISLLGPGGLTGVPSVTYSGGSDVFVSKLDPNGQLLFTDTFAGKGVDTGTAIAVDPSGNIYIAGTTTSDDFPLSKALQTQPSPNGSGFIMKLSNDGSTILYSTYFGGTQGWSSVTSLATDAKGNLYLTGATTSPDFPHTTGMPFAPFGGGQTGLPIMLTSISAAGDEIRYSGTLPSIPGDYPWQVGVGVDAAGNGYFVGNGSNNTGFVAKVNAAGTGLSYKTSLPDVATAMAVDPAGNVYVAEISLLLPAIPLKGSLLKLNPAGSTIVWTNNLGNGAGRVQSIAVDAGGNLWATGTALSSSFPNSQGWSTGTDFVVGLNAAGSQTIFSALYPTGTVAQSVALDSSGLVHVAGVSGFVSAVNPKAAPIMKIFDFGNAFGGAATARIAPGEVISIYGPGIGGSNPFGAVIPPVNGFYPKAPGGVQVTINGIDLPLLYVSANQINAVVPIGLSTGAGATVRVIAATSVSPAFPVWLVPFAPQAFPTVVNQDGTINSKTNPAKGGSTFTFYATGWPSNFSGLADGQIATAALDSCAGNCQVSPTGNVYSPNATVTYGGVAPGIVAGVTQFNVKIGTIPSVYGTFQFNFLLDGPASLTQSVWVAP